jgi:pimeloyl-ACP methyl ester carboxylesterase
MNEVASADGTRIAYERLGEGPPVIVVGGATCDSGVMRPLAEQLAARFTVINYDRRGRGESGDTAPYAIERELEDLDALVGAAGGAAAAYGHSSGAALVLHAAAQAVPLTRAVLHDPPFTEDDEEQRREAREYGERLRATLDAGRRADAVAMFMEVVGTPPEVVEEMRNDPSWSRFEALAPTLAYDSELMGDVSRGGTVPEDVAARVGIPTLVLCGGADYPWMLDTSRRLAAALPDGQIGLLEGHGHVVPPEVLVPVLADFLV